MNRISLLTVACALLVAPAGPTATASASQSGHSPIYHFDVTYYNTVTVVGKLTVNTKNATLPSYVLVVHGLKPSTKYTFGCTAGGEIATLFSKETPKAGAFVIEGNFPLDDLEDLESAQFWVMETPLGSYTPIQGFYLYNLGGFVAKIACYYSTDDGVTWQETGHTDGIAFGNDVGAYLDDLGVPDGALARIHAIVVWGNDRTGSEVFQYVYWPPDPMLRYHFPQYKITGTTLNASLYWTGEILDTLSEH